MIPAHSPTPPLRLGFLSPHNPHDRRAFSGTPFFAFRALEKRADLEIRLLGHTPPRRLDRLLRRPAAGVDPARLDLSGLDGVIGLVATPLLDDLARRTDLPLFHVTDATPAFLRDCYGWSVDGQADRMETRVAARAAATIYSSGMMADRAGHDLALPDLRPDVVPFGVNIETLPNLCPRTALQGPVRLLFIGLDWIRKGGDVAVAALDRLLASGVDARLTIVGRCPERHWRHPAIAYAGYLNKNRPREARKLNRLLRDAHLLLLPSRGDCTPMVIAEAMAHGTPVLAAETGGIASLIGGDGAGRVMPQFAPPADWAREIAGIVSDPDGYAMMADAGFERAKALLSWSAWAGAVAGIVRQAVRPVAEPWESAA